MKNQMKKPVWVEGIFLTQQHFQQWDSWLQYQHYMDRQLSGNWGVYELVIDKSALKNSLYTILKLKVLLPDFRWIEYDADESEQSICIELKDKKEEIYLVLKRENDVSGVNGYPEKENVTFYATYEKVKDNLDMTREAEILLANDNISLKKTDLISENHTIFKLSELLLKNQGEYILSNQYVPPVLIMNSMSFGLVYLKELYGVISQKIRTVKKSGGKETSLEMGMLSVLLRYNPLFECYLYERNIAPKIFYTRLIQLYSELSIYASKEENYVFIAYDHRHIHRVFTALVNKIKLILESMRITNTPRVPLISHANNFYVTEELKNLLQQYNKLYLIIKCQNLESLSLNHIEKETKCSSQKEIKNLVVNAVSGLKLRHINFFPNRKEKTEEGEIFEVMKEGKHWEEIKGSKNIALHFSTVLISPHIELLMEE
jgi:type VI secretion system protein ImpJ